MTLIPHEIANFFTAMQAGRAGSSRMQAAFDENAVYLEPFSGRQERHVGRGAIMAAMARGWDNPLPDMQICIDHAETQGRQIRVHWTCYSSALPGGKGSGTNRYLMSVEGLIEELETTLDMG